MKAETKKGINRRDFLGLSAIGLTGLTILPSYVIDGLRVAPSDRILMGTIGCGRQSLSDFQGFAGTTGLQVIACCDVDTINSSVTKMPLKHGRNQKELRPAVIPTNNMKNFLREKILILLKL
jgi:hypothetical protein